MRTRNSLTAVLSALIALLVATIVALAACAGPDGNADGIEQAPTPGSGSTVRRGGGGVGANHEGTVPKENHATRRPPPKVNVTPTPTKTSPAPKPIPPRLGDATVPRGATYSVSADRQTFTMTYSTLEAGTDPYPLRKSLSTTVPVAGDTQNAVLELAVSGYTFTDESTSAQLTITANGRTMTRSFRTGTDNDYVENLAVPLRGARQCSITLKLEVKPSPLVREPTGYLNVLALDAQFI
jgi:hypothetical protein